MLALPALADEAGDRAERAQLLRELLEGSPSPAGEPGKRARDLPGASLSGPARTTRWQQFGDVQWRRLLGVQQMQSNAPASQAIPQSQWRAQAFERDRRAEELSADILERSRAWTHGGR